MQLLTEQKFQPLSGKELFLLPPKFDDCQMGRVGREGQWHSHLIWDTPRAQVMETGGTIWLQELSGDCLCELKPLCWSG